MIADQDRILCNLIHLYQENQPLTHLLIWIAFLNSVKAAGGLLDIHLHDIVIGSYLNPLFNRENLQNTSNAFFKVPQRARELEWSERPPRDPPRPQLLWPVDGCMVRLGEGLWLWRSRVNCEVEYKSSCALSLTGAKLNPLAKTKRTWAFSGVQVIWHNRVHSVRVFVQKAWHSVRLLLVDNLETMCLLSWVSCRFLFCLNGPQSCTFCSKCLHFTVVPKLKQ